jgi:hypothetical protein
MNIEQLASLNPVILRGLDSSQLPPSTAEIDTRANPAAASTSATSSSGRFPLLQELRSKPERWRDFVVMREIFSPPKALSGPGTRLASARLSNLHRPRPL